MENARQKAFQKIRPPCIELSSVALKFRAQHGSVKNVLQALEALRSVLVDVASQDGLDEKLAEFAFFPLSQVFNASQRLSSPCLEIAVLCLGILVSHGWRQKLQPDTGKQLLILLSLLAGPSPARSKDEIPSEELICTCYRCMTLLFDTLGQNSKHVFDEIGAKTVVDQGVYLLLEGLSDGPSEDVQLSAAQALRSLLGQITNRVLLASLLPRTVSSLTKALKTTTQIRRTFRVLLAILDLLRYIIPVVLADRVAPNLTASVEAEIHTSGQVAEASSESSTLDTKWLEATASQLKLALANIIKLRSHDRAEVQRALFTLCLTLCTDCAGSLSDSLPLLINTMLELSHQGDELLHLVLSNADLADMVRSNLMSSLNSLPRVMQCNDDKPKQQVLTQISSAVQLLLQTGHISNLLDSSLADGLMSSVSAVVDSEQPKSRAISEPLIFRRVMHLQSDLKNMEFEPVVHAHRSVSKSLVELGVLVDYIAGSSVYEPLTQSIIARAAQSLGSDQISALWLSLKLLQGSSKTDSALSAFVELPSASSDTTPYLISDLYSVALPLLLHSSTNSSGDDWRLSALAVESTVLQASQLRKSYRSELIDTLYPILSLLASPETRLQSHAMTALNLLAVACQYPDTGTMLVANVDYLINSIALKLNSFDVSPQGPQVLLMMLKLCGARLIPYLDDMIMSIFAALDNFHEYPRLVELLFEVLGALVDEAAKDSGVIASGSKAIDHRKTSVKPSTMEDILADVRSYKRRIQKRKVESEAVHTAQKASESTPHRPWSSELDGPLENCQTASSDKSEADDARKDSEPLEPTDEKEQPLSKVHSLLLSIARSTIPHLSSPSIQVRLTLLRLLSRITPLLAKHENSYLPFVNDIWPAILPRLFAGKTRTSQIQVPNEPEYERQGDEDPAYLAAAAADAVAAICRGAGDFMSGRIEEIFPRVERLYRQVWSEVESDRQRAAQHRGSKGTPITDSGVATKTILGTHTTTMAKESPAPDLKGPVDLRILQPTTPSSVTTTTTTATSTATATAPTTKIVFKNLSNPHTQIQTFHTALLALFSTLLTHTNLQPSTGDCILTLVSPIMDDPGREQLREALQIWNADTVWVLRKQKQKQNEIEMER